jgi:hypothetical protein
VQEYCWFAPAEDLHHAGAQIIEVEHLTLGRPRPPPVHLVDLAHAHMPELVRDPLQLGGLPRQELAGLAEALVSITIFVAKMSAGKRETVGGPIDVALISKGDGFVWVKRKERMQSFGIG